MQEMFDLQLLENWGFLVDIAYSAQSQHSQGTLTQFLSCLGEALHFNLFIYKNIPQVQYI